MEDQRDGVEPANLQCRWWEKRPNIIFIKLGENSDLNCKTREKEASFAMKSLLQGHALIHRHCDEAWGRKMVLGRGSKWTGTKEDRVQRDRVKMTLIPIQDLRSSQAVESLQSA